MQLADKTVGRLWYYWYSTHPPTNHQLMKETKSVRKLLRNWKRIHEEDGVLYCVVYDAGNKIKQLILPSMLKEKVLNAVHDQVGHQGAEKTTALVRSRCYWPSMLTEVAACCKSCQRCTIAKAGKRLHPTMGSLVASRPLEILAMDFTFLEPSSNGTENVLVMTDMFTKFTQAIPTKDQKAITVARVLVRDWFTRFGVPQRIHSDQGRNFESKMIQELCKIHGDDIYHSPRAHKRWQMGLNVITEKPTRCEIRHHKCIEFDIRDNTVYSTPRTRQTPTPSVFRAKDYGGSID
uniref:Gypsy retrotransposon integrase-like protein 1-like n=1 Tax=Saccoglossus kowalevskii TaxID=10224 RepID=A0ABM0MV04_SACKO|nr:PREDICTED: gypsy retrotransposon integrase-like protein 1-like [Saccoglossus kowalevskii]